MKSGKLSKRVLVQRLSGTVNAAGQLDETTNGNWVTIASRWCEVVTRGSREFFRGQEMSADVTHQIVMRCDPASKAFTVKDRLNLDGRILSIASPPVNVDEADEMIRFAAVEVTNG